MTEFLHWLVAIFTVGRTVTGRVLDTALAGKTKLELLNMAAGSQAQEGFSINPTC